MATDDAAIEISGLTKRYGNNSAVAGIDLTVRRGEVFAILGPNGAGKTTTVEILEGYRRRTGGQVSVLGVDPSAPTRRWRERIGIVLQDCEMQPQLSVRETLTMYAGYYRRSRGVDETIDLTGLTQKADDRAGRLSGGQRRRLDVALAVIGDPDLIFLDEPTTGFDPEARREAWAAIDSMRGLGKTIVLTTHYMEEAQRLADRVAVIASGRVVAEGTPSDIGGRDRSPTRIAFRLDGRFGPYDLPPQWRDVASEAGRYWLDTDRPTELLHQLTGWAVDRGAELDDLSVSRPTLEDVYLQLTRDQQSVSDDESDGGRL